MKDIEVPCGTESGHTVKECSFIEPIWRWASPTSALLTTLKEGPHGTERKVNIDRGNSILFLHSPPPLRVYITAMYSRAHLKVPLIGSLRTRETTAIRCYKLKRASEIKVHGIKVTIEL